MLRNAEIAAAFEPSPELHESCVKPRRRECLAQLLQTPDYQALHQSTMLHEAASGALRDIDRLATSALREATRRKKKLVERDILARILDAEAATPLERP